MEETKEYYEKRISESPLFLIEDKDSSAYRRERIILIELLYRYLTALRPDYEEYSYEIFQAAASCIQNFDPAKGEFLHYFNHAWSLTFKGAEADKYQSERYLGVSVTEADRRAEREYRKYIEKASGNTFPEEPDKTLAEGARLDAIKFLSDSDDELSYRELLPDARMVDDGVLAECSMDEILNWIAAYYDSLQARQKPLFSDLITIDICEELMRTNTAPGKYSFISTDIYTAYQKTGKKPSQRDLAEKHARNEASISRSRKVLLEDLKKTVILS